MHSSPMFKQYDSTTFALIDQLMESGSSGQTGRCAAWIAVTGLSLGTAAVSAPSITEQTVTAMSARRGCVTLTSAQVIPAVCVKNKNKTFLRAL